MTIIPPIFDKIPAELRDRPQWVFWRQEERDGRPTKIPYSPTNVDKRASSTDPTTWGSFQDAQRGYLNSHGFDGVGFVFSPDDPYVGIDLDNCVDDDGNIAPWAQDIISQLDSYTEWSPSGRGIHVFLKGSKSGPRCRAKYQGGEVEIYDEGRYFTVTGLPFTGAPRTIEDRSEQLNKVYVMVFGAQESPVMLPPGKSGDLSDDELISKARGAVNGAKFTQLWQGDWSGYPSQSEADQALCNRLAFWSGNDAETIDRLFRRSGLYRSKWDEKRGQQTYGQRTIQKAIEATTEIYNTRRAVAPRSELSHEKCNSIQSVSLSEVEGVVSEAFDERVWLVTKCCLAVCATLLIEDAANPVGLNLEGPPSETKTTILSMFYGNEDLVYVSDDFSPRAFVSLAANKSEAQLRQIDLLPKIVHKIFIVPELAPVFQGREDDVREKITILTRVFDGEGLQRDGGTGSRGYKDDCLFAWLGGTTPFPRSVWALMGKLGSRMLFLEMPIVSDGEAKTQRVVESLLSDTPYRERRERCREAVNRFLVSLWERNGGVRGVRWRKEATEERLVRWIASVARLASVARSTTVDGRAVIEAPDRLGAILYNLARGHALINDQTYLITEDLTPVIEIALCSMPDDRRQVVRLLLDSPNGVVTSADVERTLKVTRPKFSRPTARAVMETLGVLGIGDYKEGSGSKAVTLTLAEEFQWALLPEFRALRAPEMRP